MIPIQFTLRRRMMASGGPRGETWYFNEVVNIPSDDSTMFVADFTSNGQRFKSIFVDYYTLPSGKVSFSGVHYLVKASEITLKEDVGAYLRGGGVSMEWADENLRTIVLDEPATGSLLDWLSVNATKIG